MNVIPAIIITMITAYSLTPAHPIKANTSSNTSR